MRVLVADDEEPIRDLLRLALEAEGHSVVLAADGAEALRAASGERPDVILLDLKMPVMDGREFAARYHEAGGGAPIVVITAVQRPREAAELGVCAVVAKPFELDALLDTIARCAGRPAAAAT
jgi:CheY-like chemotaxis protein